MKRRTFVTATAATAATLAAPMIKAQTLPGGPVRIIVGFAPGGGTDVLARIVAQKLQTMWNTSIVVENKAGASGVIAADYVAKAPADGYTLLMMSNTHTVNETLIPNKPFVLMRDFVPVAPVNYSDLVLVAHPALPAKNLQDIIRLAKEKPGKYNYASSGPGTPYHMAGELFKTMAGIYIVHIPYRGSSGARTDIIGGQVDMMFDAVTTMAEQARAGKVRAIATSGRQRSDVLPDVPTLAEAGLPGYEATIWLGLLAPAGTPRAIVDRLNQEVSRIVAQPEVRQLWAKQGATPLLMSPQEFDKYLRDDIAKWAGVIKAADIKPD